MKHTRATVVASLAIAVALAAGFMFVREPAGESPPSAPAISPGRVQSGSSGASSLHHSSPAPPPPDHSGPKANAPDSPVDLASELASAGDWRAFAISASTKPQQGGLFYARYAANQCGVNLHALSESLSTALREQVAKTSTIKQQQLRAIETLRQRCASFTLQEISEILELTSQDAARRQDPLLSSAAAFMETLRPPTTVSDARKSLEPLLREGNSIVLATGDYLQLVSQRFGMTKAGPGLYFQGSVIPFSEGARASVHLMALKLALCQESRYCALKEEMLSACAFQGVCMATEFDYAAFQLQPQDASGSVAQELEKRVRQVRAAIRRGDAGAFVPPAQ